MMRMGLLCGRGKGRVRLALRRVGWFLHGFLVVAGLMNQVFSIISTIIVSIICQNRVLAVKFIQAYFLVHNFSR